MVINQSVHVSPQSCPNRLSWLDWDQPK